MLIVPFFLTLLFCTFPILGPAFGYEDFFKEQIMKKKLDHTYRVFKKVNRNAEKFPAAKEFRLEPFSNDFSIF